MSRLRMMTGGAILAAVVLSAAAGDGAPRVVTESQDAYDIVTLATVPILPPPLGTYLQAHLDTVRAGAVDSICQPSISDPGADVVGRHYIILEVTTGTGNSPAGRAAASQLPRDREAAASLFARDGIRNAGSLPWVVQDNYDALVEAFRSGNRKRIAYRAGVLLHFATDAALPFNTIGARRSPLAGRSQSQPRPPSVATPDDAARQRYHVRMIRHLRARLEYEVRVWPRRIGPTADQIEEVFAILRDAHAAAGQLLAIERALPEEPGAGAVGAGPDGGSRHIKHLAERAAPILESRLEAGVLLGATMIYSAWAQAGRPELTPAGATAAPRAQSDRPDGDAAPALVGSRHSTIVHRAACQHARRVKPQNRVYFQTVEDAKKAGRVPCRSCDPYGS